jgi:hypothetical protein
MDSIDEPRVKLGTWTENDVVKVFRPALNQSATAVVGITGQYSVRLPQPFSLIQT